MAQQNIPENKSGAAALDRLTLIAFVVLVIVGGGNAVGVRFSNIELPPFWGAATRFGAAALIFWVIVLVRRMPIPRGRALFGALLYGALAIGATYGFLYWALLRVQAGLTMVVLASVPLLTLLLARLHGLERLRWRGLAGALISILGILIGVWTDLGAEAPLTSFLALIGGAVCIAEAAVVFKLFPQSHPVTTNALALTIGAALLLVLSILAGDRWMLPVQTSTWTAFAYLVLIGSVLLFYLYLYVLSRWAASATAYAFLLFPVATVLLAAWLAREVITAPFAAGGLLVLGGVWFGTLSSPPPAVN